MDSVCGLAAVGISRGRGAGDMSAVREEERVWWEELARLVYQELDAFAVVMAVVVRVKRQIEHLILLWKASRSFGR